eukprot:3650243-Rhodomonas_salina.9
MLYYGMRNGHAKWRHIPIKEAVADMKAAIAETQQKDIPWYTKLGDMKKAIGEVVVRGEWEQVGMIFASIRSEMPGTDKGCAFTRRTTSTERYHLTTTLRRFRFQFFGTDKGGTCQDLVHTRFTDRWGPAFDGHHGSG